MNTILIKEKPDLLFNNPLKQKVYIFLKNNPGKDYETFQVLTGDGIVSRQHFNEVEQAIQAREDREKTRGVLKDVNALFLSGNPFDKQKPTLMGLGPVDHSEAKELPLKKFEKKKLNERAKQYIKEHPDCTYDELVLNLGFKELSKPHFFSMKTLLRKKGMIPEESRTRRGRKPENKSGAPAKVKEMPTYTGSSAGNTKTIEILESIDATGFSDELKEHYKTHVIQMLKRLVPQGDKLTMVMLSDPPTIELRRGVR
jgi:hypothetical protein